MLVFSAAIEIELAERPFARLWIALTSAADDAAAADTLAEDALAEDALAAAAAAATAAAEALAALAELAAAAADDSSAPIGPSLAWLATSVDRSFTRNATRAPSAITIKVASRIGSPRRERGCRAAPLCLPIRSSFPDESGPNRRQPETFAVNTPGES